MASMAVVTTILFSFVLPFVVAQCFRFRSPFGSGILRELATRYAPIKMGIRPNF